MIVNCGTSPIPGKWRDMLRSTAAHSTVVVDSRNAFHFDERGHIISRPEVTHVTRDDGDIALIEASHNGYAARCGVTHYRVVRLQEQGDALIGEDSLKGGAGLDFTVRFHLHPNIQASLIHDGSEILLRARSGTGWRFRAQGGGALSIEESVYMSEGENPRRSSQIVISGVTGEGGALVSWEMKRDKI